MIPQERQLVSELFDRLAKLETVSRDPDAERTIAEGLGRAPHAVYALVQTVLLQDEALRRADARIRELEGAGDAPQPGGFLDNMRNALFPARGTGTSVPSVGTTTPGNSVWGPGAQISAGAGPAAAPQGGSFLGTAAASAAGVIGGALLYSSISSMFGRHNQAFADQSVAERSPWGGDAAGSDLSRDAGLDDISHRRGVGEADSAGLLGGGDDDTFASGDGGDDA